MAHVDSEQCIESLGMIDVAGSDESVSAWRNKLDWEGMASREVRNLPPPTKRPSQEALASLARRLLNGDAAGAADRAALRWAAERSLRHTIVVRDHDLDPRTLAAARFQIKGSPEAKARSLAVMIGASYRSWPFNLPANGAIDGTSVCSVSRVQEAARVLAKAAELELDIDANAGKDRRLLICPGRAKPFEVLTALAEAEGLVFSKTGKRWSLRVPSREGDRLLGQVQLQTHRFSEKQCRRLLASLERPPGALPAPQFIRVRDLQPDGYQLFCSIARAKSAAAVLTATTRIDDPALGSGTLHVGSSPASAPLLIQRGYNVRLGALVPYLVAAAKADGRFFDRTRPQPGGHR